MYSKYTKELGRLQALEEEAFQNTKRDFFNNAIGVVEPTVVVAKAGSIKKIQATIHDIESKNGNKL